MLSTVTTPLYIVFGLTILFILWHLCYHLFFSNSNNTSSPPVIPLRWWGPSESVLESDSRLIDKFGMKLGTKENWEIYFTSDFVNTNVQVLLVIDYRMRFPPLPEILYLNLVKGTVNLVSKVLLWENLVKYYGLQNAIKYQPMSYILYKSIDVIRLKADIKKNIENNNNNNKHKRYVAKGHEQRQQSIKLIDPTIDLDLDKFLGENDKIDSKFMLIQEYLEDPYLLNGRKINLRIYMLIVVLGNKIKFYVHEEGFIYYTRQLYDEDNFVFDHHVTTGYVDRKIYQENPLTLGDLRKHLGRKDSIILFDRIDNLLRRVLVTINMNDLIVSINDAKISSTTTKLCNFQILGVDVAIRADLEPFVMEFNRGPDFGEKDLRDGRIKSKVREDMLRLINLLDDDEGLDYRLIYEIK